MADLSDVEDGLCSLIEAAIYPTGTGNASSTGSVVKIYRGWPNNRSLNSDLSSGIDTVTVFSQDNATKDTSRYPRTWRTTDITPPTFSLSVEGNVVTFAGTGGGGGVAGLIVDGIAYSVSLIEITGPASLAVAFENLIPDTAAVANALTLSSDRIEGRILGSGRAVMETRRQEQGFIVSIWSATPKKRDLVSAAVDGFLSATDWLGLSDGTSGRLTYKGTTETDVSENANLYRRNLIYTVEYATTQVMTGPQMAFGVGTLNDGGNTSGFGCLLPGKKIAIPPLGAIRFDAWYDPNDSVDRQCASALSPAAFNYRLPPKATIVDGVATWPAADQATMDAEIAAALQAGLTFWAFDSYQPDDNLSHALTLYLNSSLRSRLKFCMVGQTSNWGIGGVDQPSLLRDIRMMTQPDYMTVLGGRPLYFVLDATTAQVSGLPDGSVSEAIEFVRRSVRQAGGQNPYVVWLSGAALADYANVAVAHQAGADAAGSYASPRLNGNPQPYSALALAAHADWAHRAGAGMPMVPTAMTGWDQRPLIQTPQAFYPLPTGMTVDNYYATPTSQEIGDHIADLVGFVLANKQACPAQIGLIYAWNELAEGGWLMPTYTTDGPDSHRCFTLGETLTELVNQSAHPSIKLIP